MDVQYSICSDNSKNTSEESDINSNANSSRRRKKEVRFKSVKIYLFERTQGFDVVPSFGGFALGMQKKHFDMREVALCNDIIGDDDITKSQDCKLSAKGLVERVYAMPTSSNEDRGYYNAFDKNFAAKKLRISDEKNTVDQTLSKMKTIINAEVKEEKSFEKSNFRPLSRRIRLLKLKNAGFKKFVKDDQAICNVIRESRKHCGCSCNILPCSPETCECSRNGIECLVDQPSFPCTCTATDCNNIFGRREFDEEVVRAHFCSILTRMQTAENQKNDQIPIESPKKLRKRSTS